MDETFEQLGGRAALERVNRRFYDAVYAHPWLSRFFAGVPQAHLEAQQTDFMQGALGGPRVFRGHTPRSAHNHMFITEELFEVRHALLAEALSTADVHPALRERWLRIDRSFKALLVKEHPGQCTPRNRLEGVVQVPRPWGLRAG